MNRILPTVWNKSSLVSASSVDIRPQAGPRRPLASRGLRPMALEQRFMFDGAAVATAAAADPHHAAHPTSETPHAAVDAVELPHVPPAVEVRAADPAKDGGRKEVVLVDTSLADYKTLEAGVPEGLGIVEFDGTRDGLAQIAQWAAGQSGLDAIHILSHGSAGVLNLGTDVLTVDSLSSAATQAELAELGHALNPGGDLLLYGCDVAAGAEGQQLLDGIAEATGADVAASTDLTGAASLGGNWTLEAHDGTIDVRTLALTQYDGVLTTVDFVYGADADANGLTTSITRTIGGQTVTFSSGEIYDYDDGLGIYPLAADHNSSTLTITITAGHTFSLTSFLAQGDDPTMSGTAVLADGSTVNFSVTNVNTNSALAPVTISTALTNVKSVVLTTPDYATFQDFVINVASGPTTVVNSDAHLSNDSGASASDFVTNVASQTITGTLSANLASGESVQVSYDGGSTWSNATTYTVGSNAWATSTTLAGSNTFEARVTNSGGSSTAYTHSYTLDTTPPTTTVASIAFSADTGTSNSDFITKTAAQTISGTLSANLASGEQVYVSLDNGSTWTAATDTVGSNAWSLTGRTLTASNTLKVKVTDTAGNDGAVRSQAYVLDTTAPFTTFSGVALSADTGSSNSDFITRTAAQTISATLSIAPSAGDIVYGSLDNGATWTDITSKVSGTALAWTGVTLAGSNTLQLKVTDNAGNDGVAYTHSYVLDTTAPTITFSGVALSADTGSSNSDFITRTAAQTISATLSGAPATGDIVYGSLDNGATWTDITNKVSGTSLAWTGVTLAGSNTLQLKVTDAAGNDGVAYTHTYVLDTTAPATPGTPVLASASDTGASNSDGITSDTTPTLSGTAENGSTVSLYDGATLLGSVTAGAGGWTYTTSVLSEGNHTLTAVARDTAGNASAASAGLTITIDSVAPATASVSVPANGTYYSGNTLDFTVNYNEAVTVDTSGGTPRIALVVGSTTRYADYLSGSGTGALLFRYTVPSGDVDSDGITISALSANGGTLRDTAGNDATLSLNNVGSTAGVLVDGTQPTITGVSASTADGAYGAGSTITVTVAFSTAVVVDTSGGTPTLALNDGGSATYTSGSGSSTLTFSTTVGAGQNSADLDYSSTSALALNGSSIDDAGGSHQHAAITLAAPGAAGSLGANNNIVIDTTAPTNTIATAAFSADTGTSSTDFITKVAAQTVSGTLTSNLAAGENVYVSLDNGATWQIASSATGRSTWSLAGQTLSGSNTLQVRVVDDAGNDGVAYTHAYVLDTTAPTISFSGLALSADTGSSNSDFITKTAAQTISATLSAAPAVGDIVYGSLDNGATWTDITSKVSGTALAWNGVTLASSNTLQLRVTDAAGNDGTVTSRAYVLDTTAPTTTVASIAFSADTGTSNSDFITNTAAQTISGTLSANLASGEQVYVSLDSGGTWTAATDTVGSTAWSLAGRTLTSSNTLQVKVTDTAGNDGAVRSQAYVLDTTAPTITFSGVALSADTGSSNSDFITKTAAQTISATLSGAPAVGDIVYGSLDNGATWTDITSKVSGTTLAWTGVTLAGSNTLQLKVTDNAGNDGAAYTHSYVLDTTAPTITFSGVALSADTGSSNSDFVTNTAAQTVSATLSAAPAVGDIVYGSLDNGATWTDITNKVSGTTLAWTGVTLAGSNTLQLKVTDAAGNDGAIATRAYVLDTTAPTITFSGVALSADSGSSNSDFITKTAAQTISATLSSSPAVGDIVYGSLDNGVTWTDLTSKVSGTTLTWNGVTLAGSSTLALKVTDAAGNDGAVTSRAYVLDTTAPTTTVASIAFSADTGTSNSDFITNTAAQTVSGTLSANLASGEQVYVSLDNGSTWNAATDTVGSNAWSLAGRTLTASNTLKVKVTDTAGNDGAVRSQAYVLDTTAPFTTFSGVALSADTGSSNSDFITRTAAQTISATLSGALGVGDIVYGSLDNGATWTDITSKVSGTSLAWTGVTLAGSNTLQLKVTDNAGNDGVAYTHSYVLDTTAPTITFSGVALSADTGSSNSDFITRTAAQTISATLSAAPAPGDIVYGSLDNGVTWTDLTSKVSGTTLTWTGVTLAVSGTLALKVTDAAGNDGAIASRAYVLDTTAPTITFIGVTLSADTGSSNSDFITKTAAQTISATLSSSPAIGDIVYGSLDNGVTWTDLTSKVSGTTLTWTGVTLAGSGTLALKVTDAAGNDGTIASRAYVLDTTAPTITFSGVALSADSGSSNSDFITKTAAQTISATLSAAPAVGDIVYGSLDNGVTWTDLTSKVSGTTLTWNGVTLAGSSTLALKVTDAAGNDGAIATRAYVLDTTAPTITFSGVALSADTGSSNSDFITKTAAQTISATLSAAPAVGDIVYGSLDNGATWTDITSKVSGTALAWTGVTLASSNTLQLRVTDAAGNDGAVTSRAYVLDTTAPTTTVASVAFSADTGTSNSDFITNTAAQTVSGTLSANLASGEQVYVSLDSGGTWTAATDTVGSNAWSLAGRTLTSSNTLQVKVTDTAGNDGAIRSQAYVFDTTAPTITFSGVALSADTGSSNSDFITKTAAQTISAALSAAPAVGDIVYGSLDNGATWTDITNKVSGTTLAWTGVTLAGSNTLQLKVTDAAGNDGAIVSRAYVLDTTAPQVTIGAVTTVSATPTLSGQTDGTSEVVVTVGGATYDVVPAAGAWRLDLATAVPTAGSLSLVPGHTYTVSVSSTDVSGNTGTAAASLSVLAPPPPVLPSGVTVLAADPVQQPPLQLPDALPPGPVPAFLSAGVASTLDGNVGSTSTPLANLLTAFDLAPSAIDSSRDAPAYTPASDGHFAVVVLGDSASAVLGLQAYHAIADQVVGASASSEITVPADAFSSTDPTALVQLSARQSDGRALPGWMRFDARSGKFVVQAPPGVSGEFSVEVIARDAAGHQAVSRFKVRVAPDERHGATEPAARPGFTEQIRQAALRRHGEPSALQAATRPSRA